MIAIHTRNALAVLADRGLSPFEAMEALMRIRPASHYDGQAYYQPALVYKAARASGKRG